MLVFGRHKGQVVYLRDRETNAMMRIMVAEAKNGSCRLGFECPPNVVVMRAELVGQSGRPRNEERPDDDHR